MQEEVNEKEGQQSVDAELSLVVKDTAHRILLCVEKQRRQVVVAGNGREGKGH